MTEVRNTASRPNRHAPALLAAGLLILAGPVDAATSEDPDWPCVQRKVPEISAGMVWAGPPVEALKGAWQDDAEISRLAATLAARRTEIEAAKAAVADFAAGLGADKNERLTLLFAATLDIVNEERASIISGIGRYTRRQQALADKIGRLAGDLSALPASDAAKREELEQQRLWDIRIYEDRERSLTYICEQPVLLEQRVFALAREIMNHLE
ncbi:MAG: hypothetical protein MI785_07975 [Kiloniellales bacterium]|nr:hypothetical protein [Kiloniellales bacterium]